MIYLDNAATTAIIPEVFEKVKPYFSQQFGNPSSVYSFATDVKMEIDNSRKVVADFLNSDEDNIYFTSGGSESDNWILKSIADNYKDKGTHIITSKIEHHAILNTCKYLESKGFDVTYLDVDKSGIIDLEQLEDSIRDTTILISIMFANNEIGTIQPIKEIGKMAKKHGIIFHTDAVQAYGHVPIDVKEMNINALSASGHKFGALKGVGIAYIDGSVKMTPLIHGGSQENNLRAGTYNAPGIISFGEATKIAKENMRSNIKYLSNMRDYFFDELLKAFPDSKINGSLINRLPNNVNISFSGVNGEALLILLDQYDIYASAGSACNSGSLEPSHVQLAIKNSIEEANGSLRFTLSTEIYKHDIDYTIDVLKKIINIVKGSE